ncbi:hypothetical protein HMPREF9154_0152 [Arachnia propionica F0230a]|nr:hypothetical protein HMPREF9154_0152 [Arachnia propionica F0230a]
MPRICAVVQHSNPISRRKRGFRRLSAAQPGLSWRDHHTSMDHG